MAINSPGLLSPQQKQQQIKEKEPTLLDKIMQGLTIANQVTGIASDVSSIQRGNAMERRLEQQSARDSEMMGLQKQKAEQDLQAGAYNLDRAKLAAGGNITPQELAELQSRGFKQVSEGTPNSVAFTLGENKAPLFLEQGLTPEMQAKLDMQRRVQIADQLSQERKSHQKIDKERKDLEVPGIGTALTREDAKILKEAKEQKASFDRRLNELIALRKKYGAEVYDREAVARGKQLSKDLLLSYKNIAKLGVLSKSDEAIINAILPSDPLGFSAGQVVGQDPILSNLEKFRDDVNNDFLTRVAGRVENGQNIANGMRQQPALRSAPGEALAAPAGVAPGAPDYSQMSSDEIDRQIRELEKQLGGR